MAFKKNPGPPPPSDSEMERRVKAHRAEVTSHELARNQPLLESVINAAGLPKMWARVGRVAIPVVGGCAAGLVAGLSKDSPGGKKLTRDELEDMAERGAQAFKVAFIREFSGDVA